MTDMRIGDLVVRKSPPSMGGFDIYLLNSDPEQDSEKVCFFNERGAIALREWISENFGASVTLSGPIEVDGGLTLDGNLTLE